MAWVRPDVKCQLTSNGKHPQWCLLNDASWGTIVQAYVARVVILRSCAQRKLRHDQQFRDVVCAKRQIVNLAVKQRNLSLQLLHLKVFAPCWACFICFILTGKGTWPPRRVCWSRVLDRPTALDCSLLKSLRWSCSGTLWQAATPFRSPLRCCFALLAFTFHGSSCPLWQQTHSQGILWPTGLLINCVHHPLSWSKCHLQWLLKYPLHSA